MTHRKPSPHRRKERPTFWDRAVAVLSAACIVAKLTATLVLILALTWLGFAIAQDSKVWKYDYRGPVPRSIYDTTQIIANRQTY